MGSQLNLASRSELLSIYKWPQKLGASTQIWEDAKIIQSFTTFLRLPHSTPHISRTKRRINKQKCQSAMCPLKIHLRSVTFDPESAEIRLLIVTHPSAVIMSQPS